MRDTINSNQQTCHVFLDRLDENDILCGRGKGLRSRPGNKRFYDCIKTFAHSYCMANTKKKKSTVVSKIIADLRADGAHFVKKDRVTGQWYDIGMVQAHDKTGHAIRDYLQNRSKRHAKIAMEKKYAESKRPQRKEHTRSLPVLKSRQVQRSSLPDLIAEVTAVIKEHEKEYESSPTSQELVVSLGADDLTRLAATGMPSPLPATRRVVSAEINQPSSPLQETIDGTLDLNQCIQCNDCCAQCNCSLDDKTTRCLLSAPTYHFSNQEVLDLCSVLEEYEQPELDANTDRLCPQDWL